MTRTGMVLDGPHGTGTLTVCEQLGGGAFGEVYRAVDNTNGEGYAVKFPRVAILADEAESLAFRSDLAAAGKVRHRNVVSVVFAKADADPPYIVMELATGGTLMRELRRRAATRELLPPENVKTWFEHVVDGVRAINEVLLHRDIKPDNILIDDDILKISDFGLSKLVDAATRSQTFKELGAMAYLAPEAWRAETNTIQRDMYAVGLTLFEIATLEYALPVPAERNQERWKEAHLYGRPKKLSYVRSDLPAGIEQTLLRLVAKRSQDRFASWAEVRAALDAAWTSRTAGTPNRGSIDSIVRAVTDRRDGIQTATSAAESAVQRRAEIDKAAHYQWSQLLEEVEAALSELVSLGTVSVVNRAGHLLVRVDGETCAEASLAVQAEHRFRNGSRTTAVATFSTSCRQGFNVVLRRSDDDDLYGRWEAIGWERNRFLSTGASWRGT